MRISIRALVVFAGLVLAGLVPAARAEQPPASAAATPPPMSAEQQAAMQAYVKAMTPGPEHEWLASGAGHWTFRGKFWDGSGAPPTESTGTAERSMLLGGRVAMEKVVSEVMGMPFEGMGLTGYDNVTGRYWSTWNDNMSTGVMTSTGSCDRAAKLCRFEGSYSDPMSGKVKSNRMELQQISPDEEVARSYEIGPDGKEHLTMELTYSRKR